jgi:hypothetical protein
VSFESALSLHGWIPESVHTTASVTPARKSQQFEHPHFGHFSFHPLAIREGHFLERVERVEMNRQFALIATPLRALMDLVCLRKVAWSGVQWLMENLRVDPDSLHSLTRSDFGVLAAVYKQRRVRDFLGALAGALGHD